MLQSFVVYGGLLFLMILFNAKYVFLYTNGEKQKSSFWELEIIASILLFAIVCGLRYDVGVDYLTYLDVIYYVQSHPYITSFETYENGFIWTIKLLVYIGAHPTIVFGFFAFLQLFFIYYAFKKERFLYPFLIFVILTGGYFFTMMNEIRQSIVWCILILAVQYANKNDILKYILLMFFGLIFHTSAIILIPLYFLLNSNKDYFKSIKLQIVLLFSVMVLAETNFWDQIMDQINFLVNIFNYGDKYGDLGSRMQIWQKNYGKGIRYYGPFLIYLLIIIHNKELKSFFKSDNFKKYYNLFFIGILLFYITYNNVLMQRPARYFMCMQIVISAYFLFYLWKKRNKSVKDILILITAITTHIAIFVAYVLSDYHTNYIFFWET